MLWLFKHLSIITIPVFKIIETIPFFSHSENNTTTTGTAFISILPHLSLYYGSCKCLNCSFLGLINTFYSPELYFLDIKKGEFKLKKPKPCQSYFPVIFPSKLECWHSFYSSSVIYILNKAAYLLKYTLPLAVVLWITSSCMNPVCARFHRCSFLFFLFFSLHVHNPKFPVHLPQQV